MQDRLKFRMFNKLIKKFSYFSLPELQVCLNRDFKSGLIFPMDESIEDNAIYMGEYKEIQFSTGFKDKNNELIFEGDILFEYCKNEVYPKGKYWIVKWNKNQANFYIEMINPSKFENHSEWHLARHDLDYEIIGNNYENLELLTKGGNNEQL